MDGENGFLAVPTDTQSVAQRMVRALTDPDFRARAADHNRKLVLARASQAVHMENCRALYREAIAAGSNMPSAMPVEIRLEHASSPIASGAPNPLAPAAVD